ncbi:hypothetical protein CC2G_011904 [Coprinopsis cinerea AmutBmut pab1-1]|nr:hypothetical protein CC2G_011904 [Coprinopsis cinerea AmutBmut pab1-1]
MPMNPRQRERKLRRDPMAKVLSELHVECKQCGQRIKLSPKMAYDPIHWVTHKKRCNRRFLLDRQGKRRIRPTASGTHGSGPTKRSSPSPPPSTPVPPSGIYSDSPLSSPPSSPANSALARVEAHSPPPPATYETGIQDPSPSPPPAYYAPRSMPSIYFRANSGRPTHPSALADKMQRAVWTWEGHLLQGHNSTGTEGEFIIFHPIVFPPAPVLSASFPSADSDSSEDVQTKHEAAITLALLAFTV